MGGGGLSQSDKKSSDNGFFSHQLILQKSNGQFQRILPFIKVPGGGSNCLFPMETHLTCDFPGGGGPDPLSPPPSGSTLIL